jgi:hypothetical protein
MAGLLACSNAVSEPTTESSVDPECHQQCIAKGASDDECNAWCDTSAKDDGKGGDDGGKTTTSGKTTTVGAGGAGGGGIGGGGSYDTDYEKSCQQCWEQQGKVACAAEYDACAKTLACTQLQVCPYFCQSSAESCIEECNAIIPSGVASYTELVNCMACPGGPCAQECAQSAALSYCQ